LLSIADINVNIPVYSGWLRLVVSSIPLPVVVAVVMIVAAFVACIAATQGKHHGPKEENEAQHVFNCVLHKNGFTLDFSIFLPNAKRGQTGAYFMVRI
jgi:hypothetical protein